MQIEPYFSAATSALAAARAAPLSAKKAMLAALLVDAAADALFAASGTDDILDFRAGLAARSDALALVFALCALRADGPRLVTEALEVPLADYAKLPVEDFMVSLYNAHTIQRVRIADGEARHDVHDILGEAIVALRLQSGLPPP